MATNNATVEMYKIRGFMIGNGATDWRYDTDARWFDTLFGFDMIPKNLHSNYTS